MSVIEDAFAFHCRAHGIRVEREFRFHSTRRWRFDFAIPDRCIAIEIEGGVWAGGRHTRGSGFIADIEKYNEAARLGWYVFRFDGDAVKEGRAVEFMIEALKQNNEGKI
jgi:very-short-patch-repair endonuclease